MAKKTSQRSKFGTFDEVEVMKEIILSQPVLLDKVLGKIRNLREEMDQSLFQEANRKYSKQKDKGNK
jgi:hypothetical protein